MRLIPPALVAHAFGQNFSLPLPLWLFMYGGVAAVALSFLAMWLLFDARPPARRERWRALPAAGLAAGGRTVGLLLLALVVSAAFAGPQTAAQNLAVTAFWVWFLVGGTYLTALFGDIWGVINPPRQVAHYLLVWAGQKGRQRWAYPKRWRYMPALTVYLAVIAMELLFRSAATVPHILGIAMLAYLLLGIAGSYAFGEENWFRYGDFLSVYFRLVSLVAPLAYHRQGVVLRRPLSGLLATPVDGAAAVPFIVFMLASTSFDGLTETAQYAAVRQALAGAWTAPAFGLLALVAVLGLFLALYMLCLFAMRRLSPNLAAMPLRWLATGLAPSLIPIAIGYNLAHYLSYLLVTGQAGIGQLSDPFGLGWNLLGTAAYKPDLALLSPYTTWYLQVAAIIVGHVAGVYAAHRLAQRLAGTSGLPSVPVAGQLPLVLLMLLYTTASLWIIAQPAYVAEAKAKAADQRERQFEENLRPPAAPPPPLQSPR